MIVFCFERETEVCAGCHLGVTILTMCWVLHALWGLTLQASPDQRDNSDFLLPCNFPAWHVAPYSSSLGCTAAPSGNTELRLWSPLCWGLFCFLQDDMISVVCYSFSAAFAKETVYHRHPHEASWNLSPGGCICPAAFSGSTPPETFRWDLIFWKKYTSVSGQDLTQKLVDSVATWLS